MMPDPTDVADVAGTEGSALPLYFASAGHKLFGWLHRPAEPSGAGTGIVICKPFGYEAMCGHRAVRVFAETAAALGIPALRFDYLGTGDSDDIDPAAEQIDVWSQDIAAAVSALRRHTGVNRVCLLGFRLGALLATLSASRDAAVDALVLIAPVLSGRRYLRELRTTQAAAALAGAKPDSARAVQVASDGSMEVSGYFLSAASIARLTEIDVSTSAEPPASQMLVIDRNDLPVARRWSEALAGLGVRTHYLALPGFVGMMLTHPHFAVTAQNMLAAMREWLPTLQETASARPGGPMEPHLRHTERSSCEAILQLSRNGSASNGAPSERPVLFGSERMLFGIVTEPAPDERRRRAVILLNAGASYHIGASRGYVALARRWASRGYVVLRMDLSGLGDSATRPGCRDNEVFPPGALEDVRMALDFVRDRYGVGDVALAGLCSSGYHALQAAAAGLPVSRILMVNPQDFFWKEGTALTDLQPWEVVHNSGAYRQRLLSAEAWKRLLTGQVTVRRITGIYIQRVRIALESAVRDAARKLRIRLPQDLGRQLEEITQRGVRVVFVFARGDPGIELLRIHCGSALKRLGDRCRIHIIDSGDHTFATSGPRAVMEQILSDELFARHEQPTASSVGGISTGERSAVQ